MKLEINHKDTEKHAKIWNLNNMFLNNEWSTMRSKKKSKRYLETNENEDTTIPNLWDTGNSILIGKFIAIQVYLKKRKRKKLK